MGFVLVILPGVIVPQKRSG